MIWCCVLSLHDENQCRNVWKRMLGSEYHDTLLLSHLYICFLNVPSGEVPWLVPRPSTLHPPPSILSNFENLVWFEILPQIFYTILMLGKLDNFLAITSPFKRSSLFMAEFFFYPRLWSPRWLSCQCCYYPCCCCWYPLPSSGRWAWPAG